MVLIKLSHVTLLLSLIQFSHCHRRIQGAEVDDDKIYAVYLVKALPNRNTGWLCGGAIVTEWYIVTSAACIHNFTYTYAIAGYRKFVNANDLENDECTKRTKKKIVFSCVPKSYDFEYQEIEKWTYIDIAVIRVESKYDFKDKSYLQYCSYIPGAIDINFDGKYQQPGTDTIALGWGHTKQFIFKETNSTDYNQKNIIYAPLLLVPKSVCKNAYKHYEKKMNIDKYMICAQGVGNIDDKGDIINKTKSRVAGCVTGEQKLKGLRGISCKVVDKADPYDEAYPSDNNGNKNTARRNLSGTDVSAEEMLYDEFVSTERQPLSLSTRKQYQLDKTTEKSTKRSNGEIPNKSTRESDYKNNDKSDDENESDVNTNNKSDDKTNDKSVNNTKSDNKINDKFDDRSDSDVKKKSHDNTNDTLHHNKKSDDETNDKFVDKNKSDDKNGSKLRINGDNTKKSKKTFNSSIAGICQNDHGGPLVTWMGAREILIGVITTFIVDKNSQCKGPYLFTSTQCNSAFLDCVINYSTKNNARKRLCDSPLDMGFEMKRSYISWVDHPSGAAKNEIIEGRQQISIQQYHFGNPEG